MNASDCRNVIWVKSSYSGSTSECVEVAALPDGRRAVRDSKNPDGPALEFPPGEWRAFLNAAQIGEFDD